jgi:diaminopimelate epimerase
MRFYKYQGTGNDFIMIDDRDGKFAHTTYNYIQKLCDRRFGIGADGLILLQSKPGVDFYMKYYNSDGNESSMCGNGGRCIAAFAKELGVVSEHAVFEAIDGPHEANFSDKDVVSLKMKEVTQVIVRENNCFVLNTGSPHFVKIASFSHPDFNIIATAHSIRYSKEYADAGINVNFVEPIDKNNLSMRTYERGVEDETLSCGTGVTAAAISMAIYNKYASGKHHIQVNTPGGKLAVTYHFDAEKNLFSDVWLTGEAKKVFEGDIE